ncbi:MAG TPA: hypothetical protein V6D34_11805, partial [Candidatus Sericytochromatia bacterium]
TASSQGGIYRFGGDAKNPKTLSGLTLILVLNLWERLLQQRIDRYKGYDTVPGNEVPPRLKAPHSQTFRL